jgi:hypothetical protein
MSSTLLDAEPFIAWDDLPRTLDFLAIGLPLSSLKVHRALAADALRAPVNGGIFLPPCIWELHAAESFDTNVTFLDTSERMRGAECVQQFSGMARS